MKKYLILVIGGLFVFTSCGKKQYIENISDTVNVEITETDTGTKSDDESLSETELVDRMEEENIVGEEMIDPFASSHNIMQTEQMETTFFSMRVDKVTVTDTVAEYTAHEGMQFLVLDIHLENVTNQNESLVNGNVPMYATDFCLYWDENMEDGTYPANTGILEELPVEYELEDEKDGKLIFLIPDHLEMVYLVYEEYYTYGDMSESNLMDTWVMKMLPVDWERNEAE